MSGAQSCIVVHIGQRAPRQLFFNYNKLRLNNLTSNHVPYGLGKLRLLPYSDSGFELRINCLGQVWRESAGEDIRISRFCGVSLSHYHGRLCLQALSHEHRPYGSRPLRYAICPHMSRSLHGEYPPARRTRLVALIGAASGLISRGQPKPFTSPRVSAFPKSGHSTGAIFQYMSGCFRPRAASRHSTRVAAFGKSGR